MSRKPMPDRAAIEALLRAEHGDPFAVLGLHACGEMWELRVLLHMELTWWVVC